jgi:replication factor C small subunit
MKEHTIWNEKFRSNNLNEFVAKEELKSTLQKYIDTNDIPHLLFYGTAGSGKTTISKLLAKNIKCDFKFVNASDENGIDDIRDKVKSFASSASISGKLKIVILDEADFLTINAQAVLRNIIESFSRTTRFILTCNYIERIIEPLQSRCTVFRLEPPSKKEVAAHVVNILKTEKIKYDKNDVITLINNHYPDIRRIINSLQSASVTGTLKLSDNLSSNYKEEIYNLIINKTEKSWTEIRQIVVDNDLRDFTDIYRFLYENLFETPEIVCIIAEHQYKQAFAVDREINFMAAVNKMLNVKKMIYG